MQVLLFIGALLNPIYLLVGGIPVRFLWKTHKNEFRTGTTRIVSRQRIIEYGLLFLNTHNTRS